MGRPRKYPQPQGGQIYVAKESFSFKDDTGVDRSVVAGETRAREGHPILLRFPHLFEPIRVHYDIEQATAAPGEQRGQVG